VLTVANFNVHAGVDGWGRPFDPIAACAELDADVLVLEEAWTNDADGPGSGQAEQIAAALGYDVVTCTLAKGRRSRPDPSATARWMPFLGFRASMRSLYVSTVRPLPRADQAAVRYQGGEPGTWGIAVLTRGALNVDDTRTLWMPALSRDHVHRAAIVVDITSEGVPLSVIGTHMSHLQYGSPRNYNYLKRVLRTEARPEAVLLGDMNLWGPPIRALMPGWHRAVKGATWPAWRPHSQIDHILVRGNLGVAGGEVLPYSGSDHRPVRAQLTLR
jgi:endonuclease/exonuclease/phosphatase family metal-dependent hydrolase